eukprot:496048-Amphidinium_carterae.1
MRSGRQTTFSTGSSWRAEQTCPTKSHEFVSSSYHSEATWNENASKSPREYAAKMHIVLRRPITSTWYLGGKRTLNRTRGNASQALMASHRDPYPRIAKLAGW